jgi:hypothetical protein
LTLGENGESQLISWPKCNDRMIKVVRNRTQYLCNGQICMQIEMANPLAGGAKIG